MKLFFIGMPGSGKTYLGKKVAQHFKLPFIDLDEEIVKKEGMEINAIFSKRGEEYFRKVEANLLREVSANKDKFLLSTGGGSPCFHQGIDFMNGEGLSVFLDTSLEAIAEGLLAKGIEERPLLKDFTRETLLNELREKYAKRISYYKQAGLVVALERYDERPVIEAVKKQAKI